MSCLFCDIAAGTIPAEIVWRGNGAVAFLDHRPLFAGHVLLIPEQHIVTLAELPGDLTGPFFWPRRKYDSDDHLRATGASIRAQI
jgi:histidine triad (HIT) family protein